VCASASRLQQLHLCSFPVGCFCAQDGVTVAKAISFDNRYENMGAQLVKQVAQKTNDQAGDGTTTATILARAIYSEGVKAVAAGMNPMDVRKGIVMAVEQVLATLKKQTRQVTTKEEIAQVATISANGDQVSFVCSLAHFWLRCMAGFHVSAVFCVE
jgi:chaperonin GroEL (HSP60 family)